MIGHIVAEDKFLHQGIDHHLFVTRSEVNENEFRFEVRCVQPGKAEHESIYERIFDFTETLTQCPGTMIDQLVDAEMTAVRLEVFAAEAPHAHDP